MLRFLKTSHLAVKDKALNLSFFVVTNFLHLLVISTSTTSLQLLQVFGERDEKGRQRITFPSRVEKCQTRVLDGVCLNPFFLASFWLP